MPIYLCRWPGYVKLGWAEDVGQRISDSFKDNSHPPDLCNKLTREHFTLLGIWEGTKEQEEEMQERFNTGVRRRKDNASEFYEESEYSKIFRELETYHKKLPLPTSFPQIKQIKRSRFCCRGWKHWCATCGKTFANNANRKRHLENPPEFNGFKLSMNKKPVFGDDIQTLYHLIEKMDFDEQLFRM